MKGKIADSIIIKVGHGIMEIPRNKVQRQYLDTTSISSYDKAKPNDSKATIHKGNE